MTKYFGVETITVNTTSRNNYQFRGEAHWKKKIHTVPHENHMTKCSGIVQVERTTAIITGQLQGTIHTVAISHGNHMTIARTGLLLVGHAHDDHGLLRVLKLLGIVHPRHREVAVGEELVRLRVLNNELFLLCRAHPADELVEDVEGSLIRGLVDGTRLLQQVWRGLRGQQERGVQCTHTGRWWLVLTTL